MSTKAIPIPEEEVERMRALRLSGLSAQEVAEQTGHSRYIVESRAKLNLPKSKSPNAKPTSDAPPPKKRKCLRCRDEFLSEWAGDRVCAPCKTSSAWKNGA